MRTAALYLFSAVVLVCIIVFVGAVHDAGIPNEKNRNKLEVLVFVLTILAAFGVYSFLFVRLMPE